MEIVIQVKNVVVAASLSIRRPEEGIGRAERVNSIPGQQLVSHRQEFHYSW